MSAKANGHRHTLLLYQRAMDRIRTISLTAGVFVSLWVVIAEIGYLPKLEPVMRITSLVGAGLLLVIALFALFARRMGYVQARRDTLLVATPFLRLKIAYRRVTGVRSAKLAQLFTPSEASWGQRRFLEPYYPLTVVAVDLNGWPVSPAFLRLFLGPQFFQKNRGGLVLVVADWMALSMEIESRRGQGAVRGATQKAGNLFGAR